MRRTLKTLLEGADMSLPFVTESIQLDQDFGYSIQAVWDGTPSGEFYVQVSNDQNIWIDIENSVCTVVSEPGKVMWNASATTQYTWARLSWTPSSGPGLITVKAFIRGF